jgi:hypothetical protein
VKKKKMHDRYKMRKRKGEGGEEMVEMVGL